MRTTRCITLDGGGVRGILQATLLLRMENSFQVEHGKSLIAGTDIFAGTSIGSIIAVSSACGIPLSEVLDALKEVSLKVFRQRFKDKISDWFGLDKARFELTEIKDLLDYFFKDKTLGECKKKVLITSFCLKYHKQANPHYRPVVFHNLNNKRNNNQLTIKDACLRSCAAPGGYFPIYQGHVDGGLWANNPTLALVAEILHKAKRGEKKSKFDLLYRLYDKLHETSINNLKILSVGTGTSSRFVEESDADWGLIPWVRKGHFIDIITGDAVTQSINYYCQSMLGRRYHRVQPPLKKSIDLADYANIPTLESIGINHDITETMKWLRRNWK